MGFRFVVLLAILTFGYPALRAQTAQEILERSSKTISSVNSFSGLIWGYTQLLTARDRSMTLSAHEIKYRAPQNWLLVSTRQRLVDGQPENRSGGRSFFSYQLQGGVIQRGSWNDRGDIISQGRSQSDRAGEIRIPLVEYDRHPWIQIFAHWESGDSQDFDWGLHDLEMKSEVSRDGEAVWHISGHNNSRHDVHLWIRQSDLLLLRSVVIQRNRGGVGFISQLCCKPVLNPVGLVTKSFTDPSPLPFNFPLTLQGMDLLDSQTLLAEYGAHGSDGTNGTKLETPPAMPAKGKVVEAQKLTPEQMAALVLIESGDGQASGFLTKLRGVNFIVTNLHVLGPDPQLVLRGLDGSVLQSQGVFGAVGRDVAIIRVGEINNELPIAENILADVKIGDEVVVVGNQRGGRVATQVVGKVLGIGPGRVEVDAQFEPGNSGSPVVHVKSGKVIGVATYSEKRYINKDGDAAKSRSEADKVEQRWFAYRLDGITQWEAIDFARWRSQYKQIEEFNEDTEALFEITQVNLESGKASRRLRPYIEAFEEKAARYGRGSVGLASEAQNFMGNIRGGSRSGIRELERGEFYDYFRTSLYWRTSIPQQLEYRDWVIQRIERMNSNINSWHSQLRN